MAKKSTAENGQKLSAKITPSRNAPRYPLSASRAGIPDVNPENQSLLRQPVEMEYIKKIDPTQDEERPEQQFTVMLESQRNDLEIHAEEYNYRCDRDIGRHPADCVHDPGEKGMPAVVNSFGDICDGGDIGRKGAGTDSGHQPKEKSGNNRDGAFPHGPEKIQEIHFR